MAFKTSPQVRYYRDTYAEHPEDRKNIEYSVHLDNDEDLVTLSGLYEQIKHLDEAFKLGYARCMLSIVKKETGIKETFGVYRMPIVDEKAPRECDFDNMLTSLRGVGSDTACVFNCQVSLELSWSPSTSVTLCRWGRAAPPRG